MAAPTPTTEPDSIIAGDTAKWQRTLDDYPANQSWVLTYTLVSSAQRYTFAAAASGADHLVTVPAATTLAWAAGSYSWRAQVSKAGEVYTVGSGTLTVQASFAAATDARSQARVGLDNINAYLADPSRITSAEYRIGDRKLVRIPIPELLQLKSHLQMQVGREEAAQRVALGLPDPRRVYVRFERP